MTDPRHLPHHRRRCAAVIALWQRCGLTRPWNDPAGDIALARRGANATILIGRAEGAIVATAHRRP